MPELGLFGKIPAKGDFVRHNVVGPARVFEQWVQESNDALRGAGGQMPSATVRYLFTPPGSSETVIGVLVPSEDKVGRKFPLAIFATAPAADTREHLSALPVGWATFHQRAAELGERASGMGWEDLRAALDSLTPPGPPELSHAKGVRQKALAHSLPDEVHRRLFGDGSAMPYYAYQTLLTGCEDAAKHEPGQPGIVLDCPVRVDVDLFFWLELVRGVFGPPPAHPQVFWIEETPPRLLVSLGEPSLQLLSFLSKPEMSHNRLWPLTTERHKAVEAAAEALAAMLEPLDVTSSFGVLVDLLVRRAATGTMR